MYNILVSNDDGYEAPGIRALVKAISKYAKVYVSAPSTQQSAKGMALTLREHLVVERVEMEGAELAYAVSGTPADCVKFGLHICEKMGIEIDYVLAGINLGANLGMDAHYSGTVACAFEGALSGYKSIALSVVSHEATHFEYICDMVPEMFKLSEEVGKDVVLNVNSPDLPKEEIKGVKYTRCGERGFDVFFVEHPELENAFNYDFNLIDHSSESDEVDFVVIEEGYASVSPLTLDKTDYKTLSKMRG